MEKKEESKKIYATKANRKNIPIPFSSCFTSYLFGVEMIVIIVSYRGGTST